MVPTSINPAYEVIAYAYDWSSPIRLTRWAVNINVPPTLAGSTQDVATVELIDCWMANLVSIGDWIQIDLLNEEPDSPAREHIFFGRISSADHDANVSGPGGGTTASTTLGVVSWGIVFHEWRTDIQTWLTIFGVDSGELPGLLQIFSEAGADIHVDPITAVQLVLQMMVRYGGTMRQNFELPASFMVDRTTRQLHTLIAKISRTRLPEHIYTNDADHDLDDPATNPARVAAEAGAFGGDWERSVWLGSDWRAAFERQPAYPIHQAKLSEIINWQALKASWDQALQYSDPAFTELYVGLVEHADWLGSRQLLTAHDGTQFERAFLPTIVFRPKPHPTYLETTPKRRLVLENEQVVVEADASGYERNCSKFLIHAQYLENVGFSTGMDNLFTEWLCTPADLFQGAEMYEGSMLAEASGGTIPVLDEDALQVYGFRPNEVSTRYCLAEGSDASLIGALVRKTYLQYGWTVRGADLMSGSVTFPLFHANIPRPGDVGIICGAGLQALLRSGQQNIHGTVRVPATGILERLAAGRGGISIYVEAVTLTANVSAQTGGTGGTITVIFSHGQAVDLGRDLDMLRDLGRPYVRYRDYKEVGVSPTYWLPHNIDVAAILQALPKPKPPVPDLKPLMEQLPKKAPVRRRRQSRPVLKQLSPYVDKIFKPVSLAPTMPTPSLTPEPVHDRPKSPAPPPKPIPPPPSPKNDDWMYPDAGPGRRGVVAPRRS